MHPERTCNQAKILLLVAFLLTACTPITARPEVSVEDASFTTEDGLRLSGRQYTPEASGIAVLLAHQGTTGTDQQSWQPFAELIAEKEFAALTFNFRGRGQSEGQLRVSRLDRDVRAAIGFLRNRGFLRIVCIGASMGGTGNRSRRGRRHC